MGHAGPSDRALAPGDVIHVDIGLVVDGFASDLQRTWYWRRPVETEAPADVRRTFEAVRAAMDAGVAALLPGARGFEVDAASPTSRPSLTSASTTSGDQVRGWGMKTAPSPAASAGLMSERGELPIIQVKPGSKPCSWTRVR